MSALTWDSFGELVTERVGPIVVKEVRQGLRGRVFAVFFTLLLVTCVGIALGAVGMSNAMSAKAGQWALMTFLWALGGVTFFVIPFSAYRSMQREREEETWVLVTLTGLGGERIVRGKWLSAMSQVVLFGSACAPFVVFSYFLNGVDLVQVSLLLSLTAAWSSFLSALGVALGTQARTKLGSTGSSLAAILLFGGAAAAGLGWQAFLAEEGGRVLREPGFLEFNLAIVVVALGCTWLLLEGGGASLALPSEPVSERPRFALLVFTLSALSVAAVAFVLQHGAPVAAVIGCIITSLFLVVAGFLAVGERDGFPERAARLGVLARPGALRSFLLLVMLLVVDALVWGMLNTGSSSATMRYAGSSDERITRVIWAAPAFPLLYLSLGVILGRTTPLRVLGEPVATRAGVSIAIAVGTIVPPVLALTFGHHGAEVMFNVFNPFVGLVNLIDKHGDEMWAYVFLVDAAAVCFAGVATLVLAQKDGVRT